MDAVTIERPCADDFQMQGFSLTQARAEGWILCDAVKSDDGACEVRVLRTYGAGRPGGPRFHRDQDAWGFLVKQARAGSAYHQQALSLVGPWERMMITALHGGWDDPSTAP